VPARCRDKIHRYGASWIARSSSCPRCSSRGKPLTKAEFEEVGDHDQRRALDGRPLPAFGPVTLLEIAGKGRFVTSLDSAERAASW